MTRPWAAAALLLLAALRAGASTSDPEDLFVSRKATDVPRARYVQGELGVLLPSYPRVYLVPAWRAIVLGQEGLRAAPVAADGMREAVGNSFDGWVGSDHPWNQWIAASGPWAARPKSGRTEWLSVLRGDITQYVNCGADAFRNATQALQGLQRRPDATPARLATWVQAQDGVFAFCGWEPSRGTPAPPLPAPLPGTEPLHWRQLRDYQIAAAHFYNASWAESTRRFEAIAATAGHPMQGWGAYLALRSQLRLATPGQAAWDGLKARADRILAEASLQPVHEATRATLRAARARLLPRQRLDELSAQLAQPASDPFRESALGDWRRLMNQFYDDAEPAAVQALDAQLRPRHAYIDWIRTLQRCGWPAAPGSPAHAICAAERRHAMERWTRSTGGEQRAWLVAVLAIGDTLSAPLAQAALAVPPQAPEFMTVRYNLARLYRLGGQPARAREIAQGVLDAPQLAASQSDSAWMLFAQERFASAASRQDAVPWLLRASRWQIDRDTGETRAVAQPAPSLAADGLAWLNASLAVQDLLALAGDNRLPARMRSAIAAAAWLRADLLEQRTPADDAARLAAADPGLRAAAQAYLAAATPQDKRHLLLVSSLDLGLNAHVGATGRPESSSPTRRTPDADQPTASMWCRIGRESSSPDSWAESLGQVEQVPPPPQLSADPAARDRELAALGRLRTATGFLADHVLARARTHPSDPDLPWLLHIVVQSTRGGCLDKDSSQQSRQAWQLLQRRFPGNPWTAKTPYWY